MVAPSARTTCGSQISYDCMVSMKIWQPYHAAYFARLPLGNVNFTIKNRYLQKCCNCVVQGAQPIGGLDFEQNRRQRPAR